MAEPASLNLQKPPGYRDPNAPVRPRPRPVPGKVVLPPSFQRRKNDKNFCRICCCFTFVFITVLILFFIIFGGLFMIWFDPKPPVFHLQSFKFSSFNVTSKSDGTSLTATAVARVEVRNPNAMLTYRYGKSEVGISVGRDGQTELGSTTLAGFTQGKKNTTSLKIVTSVKNEAMQDGIGLRLRKLYDSKRLAVNLEMKTRVGLRWEGVEIGMLGIEVLCGGVTLKHLGEGEMPRCLINTLNWINIR